MPLGREQVHHPAYGPLERFYIAVFGIPVVGLRIRVRNIVALIPAGRTWSRILDAGSGPGVLTFELARRFPTAQVAGVDLDAAAVDACRTINHRVRQTNTVFSHSAVQDLAPDAAFDLIVCVDILEHIRDDQTVLAHLHALTAPGGRLVLHVPAYHRRYPVWARRVNFDVPTHVRPGYRPPEITGKVRQAGFRVLSHGFTYGFWETLANNLSYMITRARRRNKYAYAVAFPLLLAISWLGARARPHTLGAGVYVVAAKDA